MNTQTPPKPAPATYEEMIRETARVLFNAGRLDDGARLSTVPAVVSELIADLTRPAATPPLCSPDAIRHLQGALYGSGAVLVIDDEANQVVLEFLGRDIRCAPDQFIEALDAITTLQNLIEGGE